jgi:hypothetical protein
MTHGIDRCQCQSDAVSHPQTCRCSRACCLRRVQICFSSIALSWLCCKLSPYFSLEHLTSQWICVNEMSLGTEGGLLMRIYLASLIRRTRLLWGVLSLAILAALLLAACGGGGTTTASTTTPAPTATTAQPTPAQPRRGQCEDR